MPRDSNGNYTLPPGNPVVTGTTIESSWANPTMSDIGAELTNSLDRDGRGGMRAPFRFVSGTAGAPGITWTAEPSSGFYRAGTSDMRVSIAGVDRMRWTGATVDLWNGTSWISLLNGSAVNVAILTANNGFTGNNQFSGTTIFNEQVSLYEAKPLYFYSAGQATAASLGMANATTFQFSLPPAGSSFAFLFNGVNSVSMSETQLSVLRGGYLSLYDAANTGQMNITTLNNQGFVTGNIDSFTAQIGGANRFSVSSSGSSFLAGAAVVFYAPNNTVYATHRVEDSGSAYWSGVGVTQYQWYLGGVLKAGVDANGFTLPAGASLYWNGQTAISGSISSRLAPIVRDGNGWHGGAWYWNDAQRVNGTVFTALSDPGLNDEPGTIFLVYE